MLIVVGLYMKIKFKLLIYNLLFLIIAIKPLKETYAFNMYWGNPRPDFTLMSFNAAFFNPEHITVPKKNIAPFRNFYNYLQTNDSPDILCLQEFFHSNSSEKGFTLDSIVKLGGYKYYFTNPRHHPDYGGIIGVITFSKFPVINSGKLELGNEHVYNGHWNDLLINGDTIRIVNMHLRSMSIRIEHSENQSFLGEIYFNLRDIYRKLHMGYFIRKKELDYIEGVLKQSPYKLIICADMNSLPYSYAYQKIKRKYNNSFENGGWGFGFTYKHFPWFIRIDNQFYDDNGIDVGFCKTMKHIGISDHIPILSGYSLDKKH
jgi:exonuclease III